MPIHDWFNSPVGYFHHFHQMWTCAVCDAVNRDLLAKGMFALLAEQQGMNNEVDQTEVGVYAAKANRIVIHRGDETIAVIEIVSQGNKSGVLALRQFVEKSVEFLERGIHLLVLDLFPPTARDPEGIHQAIWAQFSSEPFVLPPDKPLTLASYVAGLTKTAYVEVAAVGDALPQMPIFLDSKTYVRVPLEETYEATWKACPEEFRQRVARDGS